MYPRNFEMINGAEAIARGALDAGCDFFAGYPITPASGILTHMLRELPKVGGVGIQGEDEISSIGHCLGAAAAGATALTASSGPGLSLYSENIGLALMMELPLVIVIAQRLGPSTGAATATSQGDIQFMRWCTSGGYPVIVLAPSNIPESYHLTIRAFKLARRYRSPVFLATDKDTVLTTVSVTAEDMQKSPAWPEIPETAAREALRPFKQGGNRIHFTGSSHTKAGFITKDPYILAEQNEGLSTKIEDCKDISLVKADLQNAETLILSYGISANSMEAAKNTIRSKGDKVSILTIYSLWPIPEKDILTSMKGIKRIIIPELNLGQYRRELERFIPPGIEIKGLNRVDGLLIPPADILKVFYG
ncbi:MAG: pyruvate flavodoxin/ferredoxin oxidoreductase [Candidatus Neomarinimicrobiota bacterium]